MIFVCFCLESFGSIFVDTVCLPFGSSVNTFGKSHCDLDMLLTFEDFREKNVRKLKISFDQSIFQIHSLPLANETRWKIATTSFSNQT